MMVGAEGRWGGGGSADAGGPLGGGEGGWGGGEGWKGVVWGGDRDECGGGEDDREHRVGGGGGAWDGSSEGWFWA